MFRTFLKKLFGLDRPITQEKLFEDIQKKINYYFQDKELLSQALTHRSYVYENDLRGIDSNERMEFLGDAVLEIVVSDYLYHHFPKEREGKLTKIKGLLVSKAVLSQQAKTFELGKYIIMGTSANKVCRSILADAYEALVCAIYLDGGLEPAARFIQQTLLKHTKAILRKEEHINYKSILQEYVQAESKVQPSYRVVNVEGPDHRREYTIEVCIKGDRKGIGNGKSKKEAEQEAAKQALIEYDYWKNNVDIF